MFKKGTVMQGDVPHLSFSITVFAVTFSTLHDIHQSPGVTFLWIVAKFACKEKVLDEYQ